MKFIFIFLFFMTSSIYASEGLPIRGEFWGVDSQSKPCYLKLIMKNNLWLATNFTDEDTNGLLFPVFKAESGFYGPNRYEAKRETHYQWIYFSVDYRGVPTEFSIFHKITGRRVHFCRLN